jgi:hypothetical protein
MRSLRGVLGAAGLIAILTSVPLLAQDINIDYDHSFHFNQMKGYSWGKVQTSDPLVEPRLAAAVDRVLQGYGFKESGKPGETAKSTQMIVTAVEADNTQRYASFYRGMSNLDWHRGWGTGFSPSASSPGQIHGGTLIIDLYDGSTGKLIWRGTAAEGVAAKERVKQDNVDKAVNTMFAKFPPRSGGPMVPNQLEVKPSPSSTPLTSPN